MAQSPIDVQVGNRIRRWRENRNESIEWLAEQVSITPELMREYESGDKRPPSEKLVEIAKALGLHIVDFFRD